MLKRPISLLSIISIVLILKLEAICVGEPWQVINKEDLEIIAANQKDPTKDIYIDLGKCEEVDTQTFGKLYKVETSLLNCRPENKAFKKGTYHPFSNRCFEFEVAKEYFNKDPENILTKVNESTAFDTIVTKLVTWLKSHEPQKSKKENIFINPSDPWIALIDSQNYLQILIKKIMYLMLLVTHFN